jgi:hypothetical protein
MKETRKRVKVGEFNPLTGEMCYFECRVYLDENGRRFVKINKEFVGIGSLVYRGRTVDYL